MDGNNRLEAAWRYRGSVIVGLWLSAGFALGAGGCAKPEHRMSLNEFLDVQQAWSAEQQEAVEREVTVDLEQRLGPYRVGPGDVLMVTLAGTDGTGVIASVQARIDRNGEIDLPIVGAVQVADRELEDVEDAIRQAYVPAVYKEAACHVQLVTVDTTNVLVVGAV
ncbi:MAG: polysaccharide biosynthesis/export family protein, partial [Phycisphaerales bacterium]